MPSSPSLPGLARQLVLQGHITTEQAHLALADGAAQQGSWITHLVSQQGVSARTVASVASREFGVPLLDLKAVDPASTVHDLVPDDLCCQYHAFPLFRQGQKVYVATSDPTNTQALDTFRFHTGLRTDMVLVEDDALSHWLAGHGTDTSMAHALSSLEDAFDSEPHDTEDDVPSGHTSDVDDAPVVRFVNKIILEAVQSGGSDIHFEPYDNLYRIRMRHDGILRETATPPVQLAPKIASRLKVMSNLNIAERRVPQDGRFKMQITPQRTIDFRVSVCPTLYGEKIVIRLLDPGSARIGVEALGFTDTQQAHFLKAIHKPQGMIVVTGPTGSGKTITLYTALQLLNTSDRNISTAEDPVELNVCGVNQVQVNPKIDLDFAAVLRSFLRQDPDVIMLGEIRDLETAEIAVKAAQTGHLVLTTLHTNSAAETISRLVHMGVPAFNLATSLRLIMAQRLARRLCPACKIPQSLPSHVLLSAGFSEAQVQSNPTLYAPGSGCAQCQEGYRGRVGLYEVYPVSSTLCQHILHGADPLGVVAQTQKEGLLSLRQAGLLKVLSGTTSLEELNRTTLEEQEA